MTTIPRSSTERQLIAVASIAEQLAHQWPTYLATVAAMGPPLLRAAGGDPGRPSGHADPTPGLALAFDHHDDVLEAISAWLEQGRWITERVLRPIAAEGPRVAVGDRERRLALCADPLCAEYAVARGLCKPHYDADRYRRQQADTDGHTRIDVDSTSSALRSASLDTSAPTEGTCGRCGFVVHGVSISVVRDLLAAHHASGCPAS